MGIRIRISKNELDLLSLLEIVESAFERHMNGEELTPVYEEFLAWKESRGISLGGTYGNEAKQSGA